MNKNINSFLYNNDTSISYESSESDDIMKYKCESCYLLRSFSEMSLLKCFNQEKNICTDCYIKTAKILYYIQNLEITYILRDPTIQKNHFKNTKNKNKSKKDRK